MKKLVLISSSVFSISVFAAMPVNQPIGSSFTLSSAPNQSLPGLRAGYRQNMAGTELSYATFGLTFLKRLNIDLAVALETVKDKDDDELPRGGYVSIGYDTAF